MTSSAPNRFPAESVFALITLASLLLLSGCSAPPVTGPPVTAAPEINTPLPEPATCSVDAGVCPVIVPASVRINASPSMYSPFMSSTPGIRLTPDVSGFDPSGAEFVWNASYGHFLTWGSPDYALRNQPLPVINHGETIYWSFIDPVSSAQDPVIISLTARNVSSGQVVGSSSLILGWEGNFTVILQNNR